MKMKNVWFAKKHFAKIVCCAVALCMFCMIGGCKNPTDNVSTESSADTSTPNGAESGTGNGAVTGNSSSTDNNSDADTDTGTQNSAESDSNKDSDTGNSSDTSNDSVAESGTDTGAQNGTESGTDNSADGNEHDESFAYGFALPAWPPENASQENYPDLVRWEVTYFDGKEIQKKTATPEETMLDLSELANSVNPIIPIVAQPITRHGEEELAFFFPAGCVYPHETEINWQDGWTARVGISAVEQLPEGENPDDAVSALKKFDWEAYIPTVRDKTVINDDGTEVLYNPWVNDYVEFGNFSKNLSNISDAQRYSLDTRNLLENVKYYKENENDKTLWKKESSRQPGNFCLDEGKLYGALYMKTFEKLENSEVSRTVLAQFIPDQTIAEDENIVFLRRNGSIDLCLGNEEIISIHRGTKKKHLLIIEPSDFINMTGNSQRQ